MATSQELVHIMDQTSFRVTNSFTISWGNGSVLYMGFHLTGLVCSQYSTGDLLTRDKELHSLG